jgi:hypothetical protein
MGPIEQAVRQRVKPGDRLLTPSQGKPFTVETIDDGGVILLLGAKRARTPIRWSVLEGVGSMLATGGWTMIRGVYDAVPLDGTLDAYLNRFINRTTAGWVVSLLERAGVVEIDRGRPCRVRRSVEPM